MKSKLVLGMVLALLVLLVNAAAQTLTITSVTAAAGEPGASVDVTVTVRNSGSANVSSVLLTSTALNFNSNTIAAPSIETITNLAAGTEQTKTFSIALPSLPAGFYNATITATDSAIANETSSRTYGVTLNSKADFAITETEVSIAGQSDDTESASFTIRNTGSTTLSSFVLSYNGTFTDNDLDGITFTFSSLGSIVPGQSATVTVTADIERHVDMDTYTGTITVTAGSLFKTVPMEVEVQPQICSDGRIGDLAVTVENPDNGDEFTPGETMDIDVEVDNGYTRKMNVVVEVILYDLDENKDIASATSDANYIDNGDSDSYDMELEIPSEDVDEDDEFVLYVKAYKAGQEDEQCDYEKVEVDIVREDQSIVITGFSIAPETPTCTDTITATVEIENTGLEDQEDIYVRLQSRALDIDMDSEKFDINAYDESGSRRTETFAFTVSEQRTEKLIATVYYGDNEQESRELILATGVCDAEAKKLMGEARLMLALDNDKLTIKPGTKDFVLPVIIENKGGKGAEFRLDVTEVSGWAEIISMEAPASLGSGEQYHAYIYMRTKDSVAEGVHNFRVNLRNDAGLIFSKMASADVLPAPKEEATVTPADTGVSSISKWIFADKNRLFWIAGDLVLIILALVFLKLLLGK